MFFTPSFLSILWRRFLGFFGKVLQIFGFGMALAVYGFSVNDWLYDFDVSEMSRLKFEASLAFTSSLLEDLLVL